MARTGLINKYSGYSALSIRTDSMFELKFVWPLVDGVSTIDAFQKMNQPIEIYFFSMSHLPAAFRAN
jgi:hypothetical protein